MSFLDNLESNLKSIESQDERRNQNERDGKVRDFERARAQASQTHAEQLRKGPYAAELMRHATRLAHAMRTKVHLAWLGTTLRLEARGSKMELRPTPRGIVAVFIQENSEVRTVPVDLSGNPESLAREWLASLPPVPVATAEPEWE